MTLYARTRQLDGRNGSYVYAAGTTFTAAPSPALEIVVRWLNTPKGRCLADRDLGIEWDRIQTLRTGAEQDIGDVIRDGLDPLVKDRIIERLEVAAAIDAKTGRAVYAVDFVDVVLGQKQTHRGTSP